MNNDIQRDHAFINIILANVHFTEETTREQIISTLRKYRNHTRLIYTLIPESKKDIGIRTFALRMDGSLLDDIHREDPSQHYDKNWTLILNSLKSNPQRLLSVNTKYLNNKSFQIKCLHINPMTISYIPRYFEKPDLCKIAVEIDPASYRELRFTAMEKHPDVLAVLYTNFQQKPYPITALSTIVRENNDLIESAMNRNHLFGIDLPHKYTCNQTWIDYFLDNYKAINIYLSIPEYHRKNQNIVHTIIELLRENNFTNPSIIPKKTLKHVCFKIIDTYPLHTEFLLSILDINKTDERMLYAMYNHMNFSARNMTMITKRYIHFMYKFMLNNNMKILAINLDTIPKKFFENVSCCLKLIRMRADAIKCVPAFLLDNVPFALSLVQRNFNIYYMLPRHLRQNKQIIETILKPYKNNLDIVRVYNKEFEENVLSRMVNNVNPLYNINVSDYIDKYPVLYRYIKPGIGINKVILNKLMDNYPAERLYNFVSTIITQYYEREVKKKLDMEVHVNFDINEFNVGMVLIADNWRRFAIKCYVREIMNTILGRIRAIMRGYYVDVVTKTDKLQRYNMEWKDILHTHMIEYLV